MLRPPVHVALLAATLLPAQTTAPLPPPVRVEGPAIREVDADTTNINWEEATVADLTALTRLSKLRRLQINPNLDATNTWQTVSVADIAPLAELEALEDLTIPYCCHLTPEHLRKLARCPRLARVNFINECFVLDEPVGAALATWPALRSLRLSLIQVTSKGLGALAAAPHLEELNLTFCRDLDAEGFAAVTRIEQQRVLALWGTGQPEILARMRNRDTTPSWTLDLRAMRQLAAMPALRELSLTSCKLPAPHMLAELSPRLTALTLISEDVDEVGLADLRHLGDLRHLRLNDAYAADRAAFRAAAANLIGTLHLDSLDWQGELTEAMRKAIGNQLDLRELTIVADADLTYAAQLPKLTQLELRRPPPAQGGPEAWKPRAASFVALTENKSLTEVVLAGHGLEAGAAEEVRKALGARIRLTTHD